MKSRYYLLAIATISSLLIPIFPCHANNSIAVEPTQTMELYIGRSWRAFFSRDSDTELTTQRILDSIEKYRGSIAEPVAARLGISQAQLRNAIANFGIEREVNQIRKRYHRQPANFHWEEDRCYRFKIFEQCLPAKYK